MNRLGDGKFETRHPKYGTVYSTANEKEVLDLVRREKGYMYQTHPRTKSSTGFPDKIRDLDYFRDPRYLGAGWKQMPADLSSPRLGERSLLLLDDMNNWGLRKIIFGEVDVFQFDHTHELYAHMNVNYVKTDRLPDFDHYGDLLEPWAKGEFFTTTGEVLLPDVQIAAGSSSEISVQARVHWTFPLRFAEIVWGDGEATPSPDDTARNDPRVRKFHVYMESAGGRLEMGPPRRVGHRWKRGFCESGWARVREAPCCGFATNILYPGSCRPILARTMLKAPSSPPRRVNDFEEEVLYL